MKVDLIAQNGAAFKLYKHENPESVAESFETVGLPIVLEYREKAHVVINRYLAELAARALREPTRGSAES